MQREESDGSDAVLVQPGSPVAASAGGQSAHAAMQQPLAPSGVQLADVDMNRLKKCRGEVAKQEGGEPLVLKVQDCGGQEQFQSLLHLVLNGTRAFVVTFSMVWLQASEAEATREEREEREEHLRFLHKWCTIIRNRSPEALIFFVGTHKDKVSGLGEHQRISDLIFERFGRFNVCISSRAACWFALSLLSCFMCWECVLFQSDCSG